MCCYAEMKTGKSTTTKKSKPNYKTKLTKAQNAEVKQVVDIAASYITNWTKTELGKIQVATPVCVPIKNGYMVGTYRATQLPNQQWQVLDGNGELVHCFYHKRSAILYCLYMCKSKFMAAGEVLTLDREFTKQDMDLRVYKYNLDRAILRKDYFTVDRLVARIELSTKRREVAEDNLTKTFNRAKYYKIWDIPT